MRTAIRPYGRIGRNGMPRADGDARGARHGWRFGREMCREGASAAWLEAPSIPASPGGRDADTIAPRSIPIWHVRAETGGLTMLFKTSLTLALQA
ncbi:hypothetical protein [Novosphingobium album (ex Liu et al. 2023)]|uniref:hypothetical protein n=1 Tax=Novosphingobium album (ex Liu et al. 2023) TaxID=3031130 RepID=UPI0023AFAFFF|nr:hypothetical protein [Novosphingobium album (ex Liu et al. 2023)]